MIKDYILSLDLSGAVLILCPDCIVEALKAFLASCTLILWRADCVADRKLFLTP